MWRKCRDLLFISIMMLTLFGCVSVEMDETTQEQSTNEVTAIGELKDTDYFRNRALEHILEGEINQKGQAVGFHYDRLPTKKGEIIKGTETVPDNDGVYEGEVIISEVEKVANGGRSTFFPKEWDTQEVIDAINEAYESKSYISGNTYEGLTAEGIVIRMYLDHEEKIISAFPIYEGGM